MPDFSQLVREVLARLAVLEKQGDRFMALGQDILDAVTAETTSVDSVLALLQGLIDDETITPDQGAKIIAAINGEKTKVDAALAANTPAAPAASDQASATA